MACFLLASVHSIAVHYENGTTVDMTDEYVQEMHAQALLMPSSKGALRFSLGVFSTITRGTQTGFRSMSPGHYMLPTLPPPYTRTDRNQSPHHTMTVLPGTILVYTSDWRSWVSIADKTTVVLPTLANIYNGKVGIGPFSSEWFGVYGRDGVFTPISDHMSTPLSLQSIAYISLPLGRCVMLWTGEYMSRKVCETGEVMNPTITGVSLLPKDHSSTEGRIWFYDGPRKISYLINTDFPVLVLTEPRTFAYVEVAKDYQMRVEDVNGRVFIVDPTKFLSRYALTLIKRVTLVYAPEEQLPKYPRLCDGVDAELFFATGLYVPGETNIGDDYTWCSELRVPSGFSVTVTKRGRWTRNPRIDTYGSGIHFISYGLGGIGDTPTTSILVESV